MQIDLCQQKLYVVIFGLGGGGSGEGGGGGGGGWLSFLHITVGPLSGRKYPDNCKRVMEL